MAVRRNQHNERSLDALRPTRLFVLMTFNADVSNRISVRSDRAMSTALLAVDVLTQSSEARYC